MRYVNRYKFTTEHNQDVGICLVMNTNTLIALFFNGTEGVETAFGIFLLRAIVASGVSDDANLNRYETQ